MNRLIKIRDKNWSLGVYFFGLSEVSRSEPMCFWEIGDSVHIRLCWEGGNRSCYWVGIL